MDFTAIVEQPHSRLVLIAAPMLDLKAIVPVLPCAGVTSTTSGKPSVAAATEVTLAAPFGVTLTVPP